MKVKFPKRMSKKTAIKLSILHWQRMARWVKKQNPLNSRDAYLMRELLYEATGSEDCALCHKYAGAMGVCGKCPLSITGYRCCDAYSAYGRVVDSLTWGTWAKNAKKFLKILKELR